MDRKYIVNIEVCFVSNCSHAIGCAEERFDYHVASAKLWLGFMRPTVHETN